MYLNVMHLEVLADACEGGYRPDPGNKQEVTAVRELVAAGFLHADEDEFELYSYEITDAGDEAFAAAFH